MTKSELIDRLAAQFPQLVAKDAELAVKMIIEYMALSLAGGNRIEIRGFGSFSLHYREPRRGRPRPTPTRRARTTRAAPSRPDRAS